MASLTGIDKGWFLELKSLQDITDEDAIQLGRIVYEVPTAEFTIKRTDNLLHIEWEDRVNIVHHVCLNTKYATLNANVKIPNDEGKIESFKHNIGEIHVSSSRPVAYIAAVDFLRSKGYAVPYMGISVEEQIQYGWIKIKQNGNR